MTRKFVILLATTALVTACSSPQSGSALLADASRKSESVAVQVKFDQQGRIVLVKPADGSGLKLVGANQLKLKQSIMSGSHTPSTSNAALARLAIEGNVTLSRNDSDDRLRCNGALDGSTQTQGLDCKGVKVTKEMQDCEAIDGDYEESGKSCFCDESGGETQNGNRFKFDSSKAAGRANERCSLHWAWRKMIETCKGPGRSLQGSADQTTAACRCDASGTRPQADLRLSDLLPKFEAATSSDARRAVWDMQRACQAPGSPTKTDSSTSSSTKTGSSTSSSTKTDSSTGTNVKPTGTNSATSAAAVFVRLIAHADSIGVEATRDTRVRFDRKTRAVERLPGDAGSYRVKPRLDAKKVKVERGIEYELRQLDVELSLGISRFTCRQVDFEEWTECETGVSQ